MAKWNRQLILFLLSMMLIAVVVGLTMGERGNLSLPEKFVKDSVAVLQEFFARPAFAVSDFFQSMHELRVLLEENRVLKESIANYAQLAGELEWVKGENERLKELLAYRDRTPEMQMVLAKVVARNPDQWNQNLVINLGSRDGVKPNMAVVTARGLVGRVESVGNFSANVQLLSDVENGNRISAVIQSEPRAFGVLDSFDAQTGLLVVNKLRLEDNLAVGQRVLTSGLGGIVPPQLLIGSVERIDVGEAGISQRAYVRPAVDFVRIEEVFVVLSTELTPQFPRQEEEADGSLNRIQASGAATEEVGQNP